MLLLYVLKRCVHSDMRVRNERNAFPPHELQAAFNNLLVELHIGDAVHQQAADAVLPFKYGYGVPELV